MSEIFARAGEPVTTESGKVICYLKNDLRRHHAVSASDFHEFAEGENAFFPGQEMDRRCTRPHPDQGTRGTQICIDGEWRP